jgi:hypothetical protein
MMNINVNDFVGIDHGNAKMDLSSLSEKKVVAEMRPVQLHHKRDGALGDKPSFAIVFVYPAMDMVVYGQVSLAMMTKALDECGYKLTKK